MPSANRNATMAIQIVKALFLIAIPPYRETPEEGVLPPG